MCDRPGTEFHTGVCVCVDIAVCTCTLLAIFRVVVIEISKVSPGQSNKTCCFTGQHPEQCNSERRIVKRCGNWWFWTSKRAWCSTKTCSSMRDCRCCTYQNSPSSLQLNTTCVRRFCLHGGLLKIDPHMHTVEAGCYCATACLLIHWSLQYIRSRLSIAAYLSAACRFFSFTL